jgi:hypothetical protein
MADREKVAKAIADRFKARVAAIADKPFEETGVTLPGEVWLDYADAAIAAMEGWRPIESAPKDGTWIMVAAHNLYPCDAHWSAVWDGDPYDWMDAAGPFVTQPTHWRPLPALPVMA